MTSLREKIETLSDTYRGKTFEAHRTLSARGQYTQTSNLSHRLLQNRCGAAHLSTRLHANHANHVELSASPFALF